MYVQLAILTDPLLIIQSSSQAPVIHIVQHCQINLPLGVYYSSSAKWHNIMYPFSIPVQVKCTPPRSMPDTEETHNDWELFLLEIKRLSWIAFLFLCCPPKSPKSPTWFSGLYTQPNALSNTYLLLCPYTWHALLPLWCLPHLLHVQLSWFRLLPVCLLYLPCPSLKVKFKFHFLLLETSWKYFSLSFLFDSIIIYFASNYSNFVYWVFSRSCFLTRL